MKKELSNRFRFSLILKLPMRPELVFYLSPSVYQEQKMVHFLARNLSLNYYFYRKYLNLKKNLTKGEQISRFHTKLQSPITPRKKKRKLKKSF